MCEASHEQARATFTILDVGSEACLVDAAVDGNKKKSPDTEPCETTQNIVDIPTVRDFVICFGNIPRFSQWQESTPNLQVVTCVEQSFMRAAIHLVFLRISPHTLYSLSHC